MAIPNSNYILLYTPTYDTQPSYKISSNSLEWFRRSCAYQVLPCKTLNLDHIFLQCTSAYDTQPSYKISSKSLEQFRSCPYDVLTCKTLNLDYLLLAPFKSFIFLHAHLHMLPYRPIKLHLNPLCNVGGATLTRF